MSCAAIGSLFTGFTQICKGLAAVLISGHVLIQFLSASVNVLALIPARTIPFAWNLFTAGYIEQIVHGVVVSTLGLLFMGKLREPVWGSKEFLKFIFVVNFLTSLCIFITVVALYYITMQETYFYMPLSGFQGVLARFLVGIKQIVPDQELYLLKIKAKVHTLLTNLFNLSSNVKMKRCLSHSNPVGLFIPLHWLPSLTLLLSIAISFLTTESAAYLPTLINATYMGWIYLRYMQKKPETKLSGDPSDDFAFSSFFPEFLRPIINPIASIFYRMLCRRTETSDDAHGYNMGGVILPGSDPIEAYRRREIGARALEERLATEKLDAAQSAEESKKDALENV